MNITNALQHAISTESTTVGPDDGSAMAIAGPLILAITLFIVVPAFVKIGCLRKARGRCCQKRSGQSPRASLMRPRRVAMTRYGTAANAYDTAERGAFTFDDL
jgi:hypothetical protein